MKTRSSAAPYVDTSALVYALIEENERSPRVREALGKGATVSALVIDELFWVARRSGHPDVRELIHEFIMHPAIEFIEVHPVTTLRASEIMAKYGLKPRDAMHVALMEKEGTKTILSYDKDFDRVPGIIRIEP